MLVQRLCHSGIWLGLVLFCWCVLVSVKELWESGKPLHHETAYTGEQALACCH